MHEHNMYVYKIMSYMCIDEAFGDSAYRYSKTFLYSWRTFLTLSSTILSVATIIANNPQAVENIDDKEYYLSCYLIWNNNVLYFLALLDIIACVVNVILFIIPLRKLDKKRKELQNNINTYSNNLNVVNDNDDSIKTNSGTSPKDSTNKDTMKAPDLHVVASSSMRGTPTGSSSTPVKGAGGVYVFDSDNKTTSKMKKDGLLLKVAKKLTILTSIGVGSTFLSMLFIGIFSWATVWGGIDSIINITTTLLMFGWNKKYYQCLCACCK